MTLADLPSLESIIEWIESHEKTVDLLKWVALMLLAWITGAFRFLRNKLRRPSATIEELTSRCLIEEFSEFQGNKNAVRATFLVEVGVLNPTSEKVIVRHFALAVPRHRFWRRWKPELVALSLPNRPRHQMGSGMKFLKNWFSNFPDEFRDLTLSGTVEAKEHHSGYLLFVCYSWGSWAPRIEGDFVRVKARVHLTTGETYSVSGKVRVTRDKEKFEEWVPGINEHINHESAWGGVR
jgi:hypothetical protein